jgi:hypothetical protein
MNDNSCEVCETILEVEHRLELVASCPVEKVPNESWLFYIMLERLRNFS